MEIARLTFEKPEFTVTGREDTMSVEILKVTLKVTGEQELQLHVIDENGFQLYTKKLVPEPKHPNAVLQSKYPEVAVNKRFIFSSFITIQINGSAGNSFLVEVQYV